MKRLAWERCLHTAGKSTWSRCLLFFQTEFWETMSSDADVFLTTCWYSHKTAKASVSSCDSTPLFFQTEFWETMRLAMRFDAVDFPDGIIEKSSAEVCIKQASQGVKATRATVALVWWRGIELATLSRSDLSGVGGSVYLKIVYKIYQKRIQRLHR